jgi:hypothetical protein
MGIQNKPSLTRKRLSTLAVTTTLAAVGVGVIGTGAANAATTSGIAHSQTDLAASTTTLDFTVAPGTGADSLTATVNITGAFDTNTASGNGKVSVDWGDSNSTDVDVKTDLSLANSSLTHKYTEAKEYTVTLKVDDGIAAPTTLNKTHKVTVTTPVVAGPKLVADVSTKSPAVNSPVVVKLAGSSVDPATKDLAKTTIKWGDSSADTVLTGDPAAILATDAKLSHAYKVAGTYTLTVSLVDGKGVAVSPPFTATINVGVTVNRASGDDRYKTGLLISQHQWADNGTAATDKLHRQQAKAVVLATGNSFPDALAGVPLAKKVVGPLLLTNGTLDMTDQGVLAEIHRVLPSAGSTVYVLGGEKAISAGIEKELKDKGYTVTRLAGEDRFATALKIAQVGMGDPSHIIVARGDNGPHNDGFADALAAGPFAADKFDGGDAAIILSNGPTLDPATAAYVKSKLQETKLDTGMVQVAAIGGPAVTAVKAIPGTVDLHQDAAKKWHGNYAGAYGKTRYETAAMVASRFDNKARVGLATGLAYPDALTGGAYMATANGPLLLTDPKVLSDATGSALKTVAATTTGVDIFGGNKAVTDAVAATVASILKVASIGSF